MNLDQLLSRRLILLSGKGGVGKTTVALCLGLVASHLKKRTLIVEMNSTERIAPYFGFESIGHQEISLSPYLTGINLDPKECFEEYVLMQIRFRKIFDLFINNRFVTAFLNAVPGFNELLMVGKIFDLERSKKSRLSRMPLYDLIIVDGPATGHGVSTFEIPDVVHRMVKVGPLRKQSQRILDLLKDHDRTVFSVVSLPEEMPVIEACELIEMARQRLDFAMGPVFLNQMIHSDLTDTEVEKLKGAAIRDKNDALYPYMAYADLYQKRAELHDYYSNELKKKNPDLEIIALPRLFYPIRQASDCAAIQDALVRKL